jgi:hypothetical protein
MSKPTWKRKRPNLDGFSFRGRIGVTRHRRTLAIENVINSRAETSFVPEIARAAVMCPVAASRGVLCDAPQRTGCIRLEIGKYSFRQHFSSDHGVDMASTDVKPINDPPAVRAYRQDRPHSDNTSFSVQHPRTFVQARLPKGFPACIVREHRTAGGTVLSIDPALSRSGQVSTVRGKSQKISQRGHTTQVAGFESGSLGRLRFRLGFRGFGLQQE